MAENRTKRTSEKKKASARRRGKQKKSTQREIRQRKGCGKKAAWEGVIRKGQAQAEKNICRVAGPGADQVPDEDGRESFDPGSHRHCVHRPFRPPLHRRIGLGAGRSRCGQPLYLWSFRSDRLCLYPFVIFFGTLLVLANRRDRAFAVPDHITAGLLPFFS